MPQRDIVVIGGSAGSFAPLRGILSNLPADFPAPIFVVVHVAEDAPGFLDAQVSGFGALPATYPADGEPVRPGRIYLARSDHHLTLEDGRIRVQRGPRENRHRPAIDPLFRTAAREYGPRVVGIILSGQDDDGAAGLFAVKQRGGVAIVQDPQEAIARTMPESALEYASPHYVLRARDIASSLTKLIHTDRDETSMPKGKTRQKTPAKKTLAKKKAAAQQGPEANETAAYPNEGEGTPSVFACPECHGMLWELKNGKLIRFRCRVGHSYGVQSLAKELSQGSESALWAAMRALEEKAAMQRRIADGLEGTRTARRLHDQSKADEASARVIRNMIFHRDQELDTAAQAESEAAA